MGYSNANRLRLVALYEWFADYVRVNSAFSETGSPATVLGTQDQGLAGNLAGGDATFVRENLRTVVGWFEDVLAQIDALVEGLSPDVRADGETAWDAAVAELQADLDALATGANFGSMPNDRYRSRLDQVLITAGISPSGKSDASTLESGDGCWRDWGDAYYFAVEGSVGGGYAPLFANHPYYSSRRATNEGAYFATKEFGLQVNVQCPGDLLEGDTITLAIGDAGWPATYQVGDELTLPIIAEAPLYLAGGRDDDSTQRWSVTGDVDGPFPEWAYVPGGSPTSYADAGLSWDLVEGGIPTAKGDRIRFAIEGGHFRWRKDGGAWSSAIDVPVASVALDSGLSVAFTAGAAPSFAAGDVYSFRALQPWAVSHVRNPKPERWRWINQTGAETLDVDLGASADLDAIAIAMHTIPDGATLTLEGGVIAAGEWSEPITWREGLIVQPLTQARTARYLRLTLAGAGGGAIGWIWVGEALSTRYSAEVQVRGATRIARANDDTLYQGGATLGRTRSALVSWPAPFLTEDDAQALIDMIEHVKSNDDEPLIVVPHVGRPGDAVFGRVVEDEVEFEEQSGQNRNTTADRRYSVQFTVAGVWRQ